MMNYKSKKSKRQEHIKTSITGIIAMAIVVIMVLIINSATLNANVTIKQIYVPTFTENCIMVQANTHLTQVSCEAEGIALCKELNPDSKVPLNKANMCYNKCKWQIKDMCRQAPERYTYPYLN